MDGGYEYLCLNLLGNLPLVINNKSIFLNKINYMNLILLIFFLSYFPFQSSYCDFDFRSTDKIFSLKHHCNIDN